MHLQKAFYNLPTMAFGHWREIISTHMFTYMVFGISLGFFIPLQLECSACHHPSSAGIFSVNMLSASSHMIVWSFLFCGMCKTRLNNSISISFSSL